MRQYLERQSILIIALFISIFLTSCITSSKDEEQRRLALYFLAENIGEELTYGDQTLVIDEFKFALNRLNLYAEKDVILQTSSDVSALIYSYNKNIVNDRLVLDVDLGFRDIDRFFGYEIFVETVSSSTGVFDGDFFGQDGNYSIIIKGTINDIDFNFRSKLDFERKYDFNVVMSGDFETLLIRNKIDVEGVFTAQDGGLLNPNETANEEQIVENIRDLLIVQASAGTIFEVP